ncbi:MAG: hypothetical protein Q6373_021800 [Candidatus Sigynarchaeota archaeon]
MKETVFKAENEERQENWKAAAKLFGKAVMLSERSMKFIDAMRFRMKCRELLEKARKK